MLLFDEVKFWVDCTIGEDLTWVSLFGAGMLPYISASSEAAQLEIKFGVAIGFGSILGSPKTILA